MIAKPKSFVILLSFNSFSKRGKTMKANKKFWNLRENNRGSTQVVGSLVALMLVIIIGVMIFYQVSDSITLTGDAGDAKNDTLDMAATVFTLLPIVALVIVASLILAVVMGFGGTGSKT